MFVVTKLTVDNFNIDDSLACSQRVLQGTIFWMRILCRMKSVDPYVIYTEYLYVA